MKLRVTCKCLNILFYLIPNFVVADSPSTHQSQMLATIICVFGRDLETFLLKDDLKYDSYIILYGKLLHTWSKLYTRVELRKHLSPIYREKGWDDVRTNQIYPPIQVCPKSETDMDDSDEFKKSQDFDLNGDDNFRCSICDNTVRGLMMICKSCGHGGHGTTHRY